MRRLVVIRHGILITNLFMLRMARHFRRRGFLVDNRSYPSTRKTIEEHASDLAEQIRELHEELEKDDETFEIYAVTQSLGGLILRFALTHLPMPPLRRAVLIVPPNQGSLTARSLRSWPLYSWLRGKSGAQLSEDPPGIFSECGVPENVEMGIIAGVRGLDLLPGKLPKPHDGVVALEEARLDGVPVKELPFSHTLILFRRKTFEEVEYFFEHGEFREG